jgi:hypothetical protein
MMNRWLATTTLAARTVRASALACWMLAPAVAGADPILGVQVSGSTRQIGVTCSGCPISVETSSSTDGGANTTSAAVSAGVSFEGDLPIVEDGAADAYLATAALNGPGSLPSLGVFAFSDIFVDRAQLTTFFHDTVADAKATQRYFYTGLVPATYTLEYDLEGGVFGGPFSELLGGFSVFGSGFDPNNEVQPLLGDSFEVVRGQPGNPQNVSLTGRVTFDLSPFDTFFVVAQMVARANSLDENIALVDGAHSLNMRFTAGDTSLLSPALASEGPGPGAPVPEPGTLMLVGSGLAVSSRWLRRRSF